MNVSNRSQQASSAALATGLRPRENRNFNILARVCLFSIFAAGFLGFASCVSGAEAEYTVRQIVENEASWKLYAETQTGFSVIGYIGSRTDRQIHMKNCELRFVMKPSTEFPNLFKRSKFLKLKGHFDLDENKKPIFLVESIDTTPALLQRFRSESLLIGADDYKSQRKLADLIKKEAEFYEDEELHAKAKEIYYQSLRGERESTRQLTPELLDGWVEQLKAYGIAESIQREWTHDSLWLRWNGLKNPRGTEFKQFARLLADKFPEARTFLETPQPRLREEYLKNPERVFANADSEQRKKLLRLFYMEVLVRDLEKETLADGSNGDEIAKRYRELLPELPDKFTEHENAWLAWRSAGLEQASRNEAIELSREYRSRNREQEAREVLDTWLKARLLVWKKDGASGLLRGAEEYLDLLEDRAQAVALLKSAWNLAPENEEIEKKLAGLGHYRHQGDWITQEAFDQLPPDPFLEAIKQGKVVKGMSPDQVLRALGKPAQTHTSFSAGRIGLVWVFGESGGKRLTVHFVRESKLDVETSRVIAIGETRSASSSVKK
ncbi:MAG TPA: hypothetical protein VLA12_16510 [Planctomycetaceae bacterium]|nr:hypothetical protein [Planctomycetaceae bacterium]